MRSPAPFATAASPRCKCRSLAFCCSGDGLLSTPPPQEREFPLLQCTVSLLTGFEQARDLADWEIGVHGVMIEFVDDRGQSRTAVYLPEVGRTFAPRTQRPRRF